MVPIENSTTHSPTDPDSKVEHVTPQPSHVISQARHVATDGAHVMTEDSHVLTEMQGQPDDLVGLGLNRGKLEVLSNKADMTKIKTQLETDEYIAERNGWASKIAQVECQNLAIELAKCTKNQFWFNCVSKVTTYQSCITEASDLFKKDYDRMKVKEYIRMMEDSKEED